MAECCSNKYHKWQKLPCHKNGLPLPFPLKWHAICHKMAESVQLKMVRHENCQYKIALASCNKNEFNAFKLYNFAPNLQNKYFKYFSTE